MQFNYTPGVQYIKFLYQMRRYAKDGATAIPHFVRDDVESYLEALTQNRGRFLFSNLKKPETHDQSWNKNIASFRQFENRNQPRFCLHH